MHRIPLILIVLAVVSMPAHGVPARPLFEPPPPPMPPMPVVALGGTTWHGEDLVNNRVIVFLPDGKLHYGSGKVTFKTGRATWKLEGDDLYFEMNNQYREFKGKVIGDTIVGESWNKAKLRWKTTLRRDTSEK